MLKNHPQYAGIAWWFTRNKIGRCFREHYEAPVELPASLLALIRKLDALEGNHILRECNKHFARVRERAYEIWIASGYRDGEAERHWLAAERELHVNGIPVPAEEPSTASKADIGRR